MASRKKCNGCDAIKEWSFNENIVAFCPKAQKYVKKEDSCKAIKPAAKKK